MQGKIADAEKVRKKVKWYPEKKQSTAKGLRERDFKAFLFQDIFTVLLLVQFSHREVVYLFTLCEHTSPLPVRTVELLEQCTLAIPVGFINVNDSAGEQNLFLFGSGGEDVAQTHSMLHCKKWC